LKIGIESSFVVKSETEDRNVIS